MFSYIIANFYLGKEKIGETGYFIFFFGDFVGKVTFLRILEGRVFPGLILGWHLRSIQTVSRSNLFQFL